MKINRDDMVLFAIIALVTFPGTCRVGCTSKIADPKPAQSVKSIVAIEGPTEIIRPSSSLLFTFEQGTVGEPAPGWISTGPDNSMDEVPGLHVIMVDPLDPDNKVLGTTDTGINIHAHYEPLVMHLQSMLGIEMAMCLRGPGVIPEPSPEGEPHPCIAHGCDEDGDGDIDLADFAVWQRMK